MINPDRSIVLPYLIIIIHYLNSYQKHCYSPLFLPTNRVVFSFFFSFVFMYKIKVISNMHRTSQFLFSKQPSLCVITENLFIIAFSKDLINIFETLMSSTFQCFTMIWMSDSNQCFRTLLIVFTKQIHYTILSHYIMNMSTGSCYTSTFLQLDKQRN
jgi:hypothetical protein